MSRGRVTHIASLSFPCKHNHDRAGDVGRNVSRKNTARLGADGLPPWPAGACTCTRQKSRHSKYQSPTPWRRWSAVVTSWRVDVHAAKSRPPSVVVGDGGGPADSGAIRERCREAASHTSPPDHSRASTTMIAPAMLADTCLERTTHVLAPMACRRGQLARARACGCKPPCKKHQNPVPAPMACCRGQLARGRACGKMPLSLGGRRGWWRAR